MDEEAGEMFIELLKQKFEDEGLPKNKYEYICNKRYCEQEAVIEIKIEIQFYIILQLFPLERE